LNIERDQTEVIGPRKATGFRFVTHQRGHFVAASDELGHEMPPDKSSCSSYGDFHEGSCLKPYAQTVIMQQRLEDDLHSMAMPTSRLEYAG